MSQPYEAVVCDLLSALLNADALWGRVAKDADLGRRWRQRSLSIITASGGYRPYEDAVAQAAKDVGLPDTAAGDVLARWDDIEPWPSTLDAIRPLTGKVALAIVTNCSDDLAYRGAARVGVPFDVVISAERAGFYKPDPRAYQLALEELSVAPARALFVAGSAHDVTGAARVGMPVFWHNRRELEVPPGGTPIANETSLARLPAVALGVS